MRHYHLLYRIVFQAVHVSDWLTFLCRYGSVLRVAHDEEHLTKFEQLLEAAIDLDRVPEEFLISPHYDERLKVCLHIAAANMNMSVCLYLQRN